MRLLFLTHRLPYAPNRGDRIRAYHLARVLSARHDVHVVSFVHDEEEARHADTLRALVKSVTPVRVHKFSRIVAGALALPTRVPLTHVLLHSRAMPEVLAGIRQQTDPQVVLAYCTSMARYAMEPALDGLPWVLDMVDVDSEKWAALASTGNRLLRPVYHREARLLRRFEAHAMTRASATTVVSQKEKATLREVAPDIPVHVVPNGIDCATFAPTGPPADLPEAVFCGVFNYEPNAAGAVWLAREVWPLVLKAVPTAKLSLVGMLPTAAVLSLASQSIRVTGAVPDVRPFLWNAAVGLAPLLVARGVQNKVLEAVAAGLPCVVTPAVFDGLPAMAHPACRQAPDAGSFAHAIVDLFAERPARRRAIAESADLRGLSWEAQLQPMLDYVERAPSR